MVGSKVYPPPVMVEDFLTKGRICMKKTGFYIIKDSFFDDMNEPYLKGNKEGNRPHYYRAELTSTKRLWTIRRRQESRAILYIL